MAERAIDALPMPAAYFKLVLRRFGQSPERAARILEGTGIDPADAMASAPDDVIGLGQQLRQVRNLLGLASPGWGLEIGRALDGAAHGILGVATTSAPSLAEALSVLERYAHVRAPYFRLASDPDRSAFRLSIETQLRLEPEVWPPLVETLLLSIQALIESALGRPMVEGRFHAGYDTPPYAERYDDFFHAPVVFGERASAVSIPTAWLPLPCPFADAALHQTAVERLEAAERSLQGPEFIVAQVERILEGAGDAAPGLDPVASQLRLSRRTLVRRLEQCGTSFRELADGHRRRRATELLADPTLTVTEVAYRLGYTEPANFGRAFRRWFGTSPRAYREAGYR
jgi:AraC-like DNA-binding protein